VLERDIIEAQNVHSIPHISYDGAIQTPTD